MSSDMLAAFDDWIAEQNGLLAIPLTVVARAPGSIRLTFDGVIKAVEVIVVRDEIMVLVEHGGVCYDILADFECSPVIVTDGVVCGLCDEVGRTIYPTRQTLFVEHVFRPFADWIRTKLVPADALGLGGGRHEGATWAVLLSDDDYKGYEVIVPLRG